MWFYLTPQVKQKKRCLQGAFFAERVAVLRQSNSHARPRAERSFYEVERRASSVQRQPKKRNKVEQIHKVSPFGRSYWGWWLGERATAEKISGGGRKHWPRFFSGVCVADKVATTNAGRERVETGNADNKKRAAPFSELLFFLVASGLWNGRRYDWLEQPSGTKRTTEERPLVCLLFICRLFLFTPKCRD